MRYEVLSDIGRKRTTNEDRAAVFVPEHQPFPLLAVIADGMGGHKGGDFASETVVRTIGERFLQISDYDVLRARWRDWLIGTIQEVNYDLYDIALREEQYNGMGTTLDVVLIYEERVFIAHVGDSRVYRIGRDEAIQVTKDHSYVNVLIDSGEITREEAKVHPQRNWIVKAVGTERRIDVDLYTFERSEETLLLLCTDGLSNKVELDEMVTFVTRSAPLKERAQSLIDVANERGGEDNISVILVESVKEEVEG